jgi:ABC-type nitrate/sulfonate/bicarbonate transport system ATPase subunit
MGTGPVVNSSTDVVRISAAHKNFGPVQALHDVDLTIGTGEFLAILGRSGSGKSTLLRVLAGLEPLSSGTVNWTGPGGRPQTGVVFQQPLLMPWLTVAENIAFAGRFGAHRASFDATAAEELTDGFGLRELAQRYPDQLSGGQAQRVAVLRAVATRPRLLLLDEPFSALDPAIRNDLQRWLAELAGELDVTVVLVTHDVAEALALSDRVVLLREGRLAGEWRPAQRAGDIEALRVEILQRYQPDDVTPTVRAAT